MIRLSELAMPLDYRREQLSAAAAKKLKCPPAAITSCRLMRQAVDARRKDNVHFSCTVDVTVAADETTLVRRASSPRIRMVNDTPYAPPTASPSASRPVVVGSGPAGLFAALRELDKPDVKRIFARCPKGEGIAYAVENRLKKAAGFQVIQAEECL